MSLPKKYDKEPPYRRPTMEDKIKIIGRLEAGASNKDLALEYNVHASTISNIWKNKENLREKDKLIEKSHGSRKRTWAISAVNSQLDNAMFQWFLEKRSQNEPVSGPLLKEKALDLNKLLNGPKNFNASNGWIEKFKKRHNISQKVAHGEKLSADQQASEEFVEFFKTYIAENEYDLDAVYNADETGVYWKSLPRETLAAHTEHNVSGCKLLKDRVTVMACANATGTHAIPLLVIGKSNKPRCFKNVKKLSVTYKGQKSAWISRDIFTEWFTTVFLPSVRERIGNKKILLLLDNAPTHPCAEMLNKLDERCHIMYLPPNVTSLIQPMDQGVIASLKRHYKKDLLRELLMQENTTVAQFSKSLNMLICCESLSKAWDSVTRETLKNAWKKFNMIDELSQQNSDQQVFDELQSCIGEVCMYVRNIEGSSEFTPENAMTWFNEEDGEYGWQLSDDEQLLNMRYGDEENRESVDNDEDEENQESFHNDEDEMTEGEEEEPTCREALRALDTFTKWFHTQWDGEPQDFLALRKVRKVAEDTVLNLM